MKQKNCTETTVHGKRHARVCHRVCSSRLWLDNGIEVCTVSLNPTQIGTIPLHTFSHSSFRVDLFIPVIPVMLQELILYQLQRSLLRTRLANCDTQSTSVKLRKNLNECRNTFIELSFFEDFPPNRAVGRTTRGSARRGRQTLLDDRLLVKAGDPPAKPHFPTLETIIFADHLVMSQRILAPQITA